MWCEIQCLNSFENSTYAMVIKNFKINFMVFCVTCSTKLLYNLSSC